MITMIQRDHRAGSIQKTAKLWMDPALMDGSRAKSPFLNDLDQIKYFARAMQAKEEEGLAKIKYLN